MALVFPITKSCFFGDKYDRAVVGGRCAGVRRVPSLRVEESALNFLGGSSMTVEASLRVPHPLGPGGYILFIEYEPVD